MAFEGRHYDDLDPAVLIASDRAKVRIHVWAGSVYLGGPDVSASLGFLLQDEIVDLTLERGDALYAFSQSTPPNMYVLVQT